MKRILVKIKANFCRRTSTTRMYQQICYLIIELLIVKIIALCFWLEQLCVFTLFWYIVLFHPSWL